MSNKQEIDNKTIIEETVAQTNPLDSSHDYHNVDEIARDLGVESDCGQEISMSDHLKSRDKTR